MKGFELHVPEAGRLLEADGKSIVSLLGTVDLFKNDPDGMIDAFFEAVHYREVDRKRRAVKSVISLLNAPLTKDETLSTPFLLTHLPVRQWGSVVAASNGVELKSEYDPQQAFPSTRNSRILDILSDDFRAPRNDGFIHTRRRRFHDEFGDQHKITEQLGIAGTIQQRRCRDRLAANDFPQIPVGAGGTVLTPTFVMTVLNRSRLPFRKDSLDIDPSYDDPSESVYDVGELCIASSLLTFDCDGSRRASITSFMDCSLRSWLRIISKVRNQLVSEKLLLPKEVATPLATRDRSSRW